MGSCATSPDFWLRVLVPVYEVGTRKHVDDVFWYFFILLQMLGQPVCPFPMFVHCPDSRDTGSVHPEEQTVGNVNVRWCTARITNRKHVRIV